MRRLLVHLRQRRRDRLHVPVTEQNVCLVVVPEVGAAKPIDAAAVARPVDVRPELAPAYGRALFHEAKRLRGSRQERDGNPGIVEAVPLAVRIVGPWGQQILPIIAVTGGPATIRRQLGVAGTPPDPLPLALSGVGQQNA